ncbi:MAG TPA: thiamine-phosphate kinase [Vicinamibacteria bacterium]|nr:thiamine-phosphate kinase [Vicinamibacteria bacterium]
MNQQTRVGDLGERTLIERLRSRIPPGEGVVVGLGDDAAAVVTAGLTLVTADCLVEGVHFRRPFTPPRLLGRKALSVNLSDIAAMGGVSRYAIVSLCLPSDLPLDFLDGLYDGLLERAGETGVSLVGGNLSSASGGMVIDLTLLGSGEPRLLRSRARSQDLVVVTGRLGAAGAGLRYLEEGFRIDEAGSLLGGPALPAGEALSVAGAIRAHLDPAPPLWFGAAVAAEGLAACGMDLSDGLSGDLLTVCRESGVSAVLDSRALPIDAGAARLGEPVARELALHAGEDYQLLLGVAPDRLAALRALAGRLGVELGVIGHFEPGPAEVLVQDGEDRCALAPRAHQHFRDSLSERGARRA